MTYEKEIAEIEEALAGKYPEDKELSFETMKTAIALMRKVAACQEAAERIRCVMYENEIKALNTLRSVSAFPAEHDAIDTAIALMRKMPELVQAACDAADCLDSVLTGTDFEVECHESAEALRETLKEVDRV